MRGLECPYKTLFQRQEKATEDFANTWNDDFPNSMMSVFAFIAVEQIATNVVAQNRLGCLTVSRGRGSGTAELGPLLMITEAATVVSARPHPPWGLDWGRT